MQMCLSDHILQSAFSMFMKFGVRSVSMDDLAQDLGMSKKTIYSVFPSKETLISVVILNHLKNDEKQIKAITTEASDAIEEILKISQHVMKFLTQIQPSLIFDLKKFYPNCWALIEKQHFHFIKETIEANILRGQKEGLYRADLHADIVAKLYVGKSNILVNPEVFPIEQYDLFALIREMGKYHLYGIASAEGRAKLASIPFYSS
jgi:AcrR family transcriptional regulator